jgi:3-hydroxy acid dehydrogenase / malonic semialdehyde reductase
MMKQATTGVDGAHRRNVGGVNPTSVRLMTTDATPAPATFGPGAVAVVTGASGGIGRAIVDELRSRGFVVHAVALADAAIESLHGIDGVCVHPLDVRDTAALAALIAEIDVDVLVNNAGIIGELQPIQQYRAATADALIDINLRASVQATLAALPGMVARNRGHIFFTGSIAGSRPTANTAVYSATKAGLAAFAEGLRMDLLGTALRVTLLAPGRVETNLYDATLGGHDAAVAKLYSGATAIQPADLAALVGVALSLPAHVDVTRLEVMPTAQVFGGSAISS